LNVAVRWTLFRGYVFAHFGTDAILQRGAWPHDGHYNTASSRNVGMGMCLVLTPGRVIQGLNGPTIFPLRLKASDNTPASSNRELFAIDLKCEVFNAKLYLDIFWSLRA
jgi:hypothetical protein